MQKIVSGTVSCQDQGLKLEHFLKTGLHLSGKEISRAKFRENGICVNGERRRIDVLLKDGDFVEVLMEADGKTSGNVSSSRENVCVLYEDNDVIVLNKPAGISVHPAGRKDTDTLANRLAYYLRGKEEDSVIRIFGRLDQDTSGVVLAVKNKAAATRLERQREKGALSKTYLAVTEGVPDPPAGAVRLPIGTDPGNRRRMCIAPDGKRAVTDYETLAVGNGCALIRLSPETGRTHQIRVHMAAVGCPLAGDPVYGTGMPPCLPASFACGGAQKMPRTALHARSLRFLQPFTGEKLLIEAPVPEDMRLYMSERIGIFP